MNVQKRETKKFFILQVQRRETATNHTPVYTFGLGYPPQDKNKFIHKHSKLKDYEKSKSDCNN